MIHPEQMPDPRYTEQPLTEREIQGQGDRVEIAGALTERQLAQEALKSMPTDDMEWLVNLLADESLSDRRNQDE